MPEGSPPTDDEQLAVDRRRAMKMTADLAASVGAVYRIWYDGKGSKPQTPRDDSRAAGVVLPPATCADMLMQRFV